MRCPILSDFNTVTFAFVNWPKCSVKNFSDIYDPEPLQREENSGKTHFRGQKSRFVSMTDVDDVVATDVASNDVRSNDVVSRLC